MKRYFLVLLAGVLASACGVQIKSVVDHSAITSSYKNPLIVIPFENGVTRNFTRILKEKIEGKFKAENRKIEILLVEQNRDELKLNSSPDINAKINSVIAADDKDLVLIFRPTKMQFYNGGLQSATYLITGTDIKSRKEIWKAEFTSSSSFGPSLFAEDASATIYAKLKSDKVI